MYIPDDAKRFVSEGDGSPGRPVYDIFRLQVMNEEPMRVVNGGLFLFGSYNHYEIIAIGINPRR
jgi:hypothetical protein